MWWNQLDRQIRPNYTVSLVKKLPSRRSFVGTKVTFFIVISLCMAIVISMAYPSRAQEAHSGADELFERGVKALKAEQYEDAISLFRVSYDMKQQAATQCNLALAYEKLGGHVDDAIKAYQRCAHEDDSGRFRDHALNKVYQLTNQSQTKVEPPPPPPPPEKQKSPPNIKPPWPVVPMKVVWHRIAKTEGCSFFSGPGKLGHVDQLGNKAKMIKGPERVLLEFDGNRVFRGKMIGTLVTVTRQTLHQKNGRPWIVEETISGMIEKSILHGFYHYRDCDGQAPQNCPSQCKIRAQVSIGTSR